MTDTVEQNGHRMTEDMPELQPEEKTKKLSLRKRLRVAAARCVGTVLNAILGVTIAVTKKIFTMQKRLDAIAFAEN